jgi:hypothetical protein
MTTMLHALPDATDFDLRRQLGELESVSGSAAGSTYLAEAYTGWPSSLTRQTKPEHRAAEYQDPHRQLPLTGR